ncbi:MAG: MFS transporter [Francisellaceae bacterium]
MTETIKRNFKSFSHSGFRHFIWAVLISGAGDALIPIAFAIESTRIEPSGWGFSCVLLALWVSRFIGMTLYKQLASRFKALNTMISADMLRILAQLGLLLWICLFENSIWAMSVSAFIYGLATAFFMPARFVLIPEIIEKSMRKDVNAWLAIAGDIYTITGPLLGAFVVIWLNFQSVLLFDVISFMLGLIFLLKLKKHQQNSVSASVDNDKQKTVDINIAENNNDHTDAKLPNWALLGLISWFFCSLTIGFMAAAGPTLVIEMYSASSWAVVAMIIAGGSLIGSLSSLIGLSHRISWVILHLLCSVALGVQLVTLVLPDSIWLLYVFAFLGSAFTSLSGIRWDTIGQNSFSGKQLHDFASFDQFVNTAAIPLGMLLFGLSGFLGGRISLTLIIALITALSAIPILSMLWKADKKALLPSTYS